MPRLVVKKEVWLKLAQELSLGQPAQKHGLVDLDVPVHQGADGALMGRGAACCDQRGANAHGRGALDLQALQRGQQGLERPGQQRLLRLGAFVPLEGVQALRLIHPLGLVAEQHGVAVKGNAHLVRVCFAGMGRVRVNLGRRHTGIERGAYIAQVGAEKQVGMQRFEVAPGRLAAGEAAALDRQAVMLRRAEHPHARDRVVARQNNHLHRLAATAPGWPLVEGQQLFHQRKRHAGAGRLLQPLQLQCHVGPVVTLLKHLVFLLKIKQGARRDRHHQFAVQGAAAGRAHVCKNMR